MISLMRNHDLDQEQANVSNLCCPSVSLSNQQPNSLYTLRKADQAAAAVNEFRVLLFFFFMPGTCEILMHNVWTVWFFYTHFLKYPEACGYVAMSLHAREESLITGKHRTLCII